MRDMKKILLATVVAVALPVVLVLAQWGKLQANLRATTKITRSLRDQIDRLTRENKESHAQVDALSAELKNLKDVESTSGKKNGQLETLVAEAEKTLERQNLKISQLEMKLRETEDRVKRQKKQSASLEAETKSARSNPAATAEYANLMENEWLAALAKTEDLKKGLDKTAEELASYNQERARIQKEAATMHYNLAVILTNQNDFPAAVREYKKVLEMRPNDADAHYNLAVIYDTELKNTEEALRHYRAYIQAAPNSPEAPRVLEWIKDKEFQNTFKHPSVFGKDQIS
jgi:tetratricopeptide (TPR) repeat protein